MFYSPFASMLFYQTILLTLLGALLRPVAGAICNLKPSYAAPVVANGWQAQLLAQGLTAPRSILFDSNGGLIVLQKGNGVVHLQLTDGGGTCFDVAKKTTLISDRSLNHGLALSADGKTLYASSAEAVYSWVYNPATPSVSTAKQTLVTGMNSAGHTSRTLMMSKRQPGMLVVSRGSDGNIDLDTADIASGRSQIKAFNLTKLTSSSQPYDYSTQGLLLGWGLRNSVGVAEEPLTGGIYSVENSADQIRRNGVDIHQNNPGEEMNFHGYLNGSTKDQGGNYGYPYCFALWDTSIPALGNLKVGSQFALDQGATINDAFCASERVPPRLTFQAHMAPLNIIFSTDGREAFVTFHGSWNRATPIGYKLSSIAFTNGHPVAAPDSLTSTTDILTNPNTRNCPGSCFRPVGLAWDSKKRLFMSSDSTGEIWVLARTAANVESTVEPRSGTASPTPTPTSFGLRLELESRSWFWAVLAGMGFAWAL